MDKNFFDDSYENEEFEEDYNDEEYYEEDEHNDKKGKNLSKGFFTALAVCLVAVGAAVWTTVNNVNEYIYPDVSSVTESEKVDVSSGGTVSEMSSAPAIDAQVDAKVSTKSESQNSGPEDFDSDIQVQFTVKPISGKVVQKYTETPVYNSTLGDYRAHPAVDYAADIDDKVRCMGRGVVADIYYDEMYGNIVKIKHSKDVYSYYCGLARTTLVQKGDVVSAGDFIGTVYSIPCETADKSHVHIAVESDGKWISPDFFTKAD